MAGGNLHRLPRSEGFPPGTYDLADPSLSNAPGASGTVTVTKYLYYPTEEDHVSMEYDISLADVVLPLLNQVGGTAFPSTVEVTSARLVYTNPAEG